MPHVEFLPALNIQFLENHDRNTVLPSIPRNEKYQLIFKPVVPSEISRDYDVIVAFERVFVARVPVRTHRIQTVCGAAHTETFVSFFTVIRRRFYFIISPGNERQSSRPRTRRRTAAHNVAARCVNTGSPRFRSRAESAYFRFGKREAVCPPHECRPCQGRECHGGTCAFAFFTRPLNFPDRNPTRGVRGGTTRVGERVFCPAT